MLLRARRGASLSTWVVVLLAGTPAAAQVPELVGTRALGMGSAFTAVADDASAVYWNPAGMATGAYVSVLIDQLAHEFRAGDDSRNARAGVRGSGTFVGLTTPVIGVAYYRVRASGAEAASGDGSDLVTHHLAVSVAQTVVERLHVGGAVRIVRGSAGRGSLGPTGDLEGTWDAAGDLPRQASTKMDADLGVMFDGGRFRMGLTARNLAEPDFETPDGGRLGLERTLRVGGAIMASDRTTFAVDADLATTAGTPAGRRRSLAGGFERWFAARRLALRGGLRIQTVDEPRPAGSLGGSVLLGRSVNLDAQVTRGGERGDRGWSLSARVSF